MCNSPLVLYSLEVLDACGVDEVFVYVGPGRDRTAVKAFLATLRREKKRGKASVQLLETPDECKGAGDVLRFVDSMNIIKDTFVLVDGALVSNMDLKAVLAAHKARKSDDLLMTCVFRHCAPWNLSRSERDDLLLVLGEDQQVLSYQCTAGRRSAAVATSALSVHSKVTLRTDVMDSGVYICSPKVPLEFTEHFDALSIAEYFEGFLAPDEADVVSHKVYARLLTDEYAARVQDLKTYRHNTSNLFFRWAMPVNPGENLFPGTSYAYSKAHASYIEKGVVVPRSAKVSHCVIGAGCTLEEGCVVSRCILGRASCIKAGATVHGSVLLASVVVESGAQVDTSVLAEGVVVGAGATVARGCVLASGVQVPQGGKIEGSTHLTRDGPFVHSENFDMALDGLVAQRQWTPHMTYLPPGGGGGDGGNGDSDEEGDDGDDGDDSDGLGSGGAGSGARGRDGDGDGDGDNNSGDGSEEDDGLEDSQFALEILDQFRAKFFVPMPGQGHNNKELIDNVVSEIGALRIAHNREFSEVGPAVITAFLKLQSEAKGGLKEWGACLKAWSPVLKNYVKDEDDEFNIVVAVDDHFSHPQNLPNAQPAVKVVLTVLYNEDIVSEETFFNWEEAVKEDEDESLFLPLAQAFLDALREVSSEEESDD